MARATGGVVAKGAVAKTGKAPAPARRAVKSVPKAAVAGKAPAASAKALAKPALKAAVKSAAKPSAVSRPALQAARKPVAAPARARSRAAPAPAPLEERAAAVRAQLVRDSFTMPEAEYAVLGAVKSACLKAGFEVKKSELLRIGVALLGQLDMPALRTLLAYLPQLKTGRPPIE